MQTVYSSFLYIISTEGKMATSKFLKDFDDITQCCICREVYKRPKVLPCLHTFCLKCLQQYAEGLSKKPVDSKKPGESKEPGDNTNCPLCRQEFVIPQGGIASLPGNFFIEKLVDLRKGSDVNGLMCELCVEKGETADVKKVAKWRCVNCGENMCDHCSKAHKNSRLSRSHQVVDIGGELTDIHFKLWSSFCEKHSDKQIELFCDDCQKVICIKCCLIEHKSHNISDIELMAEKFRQKLQGDVERIVIKLGQCQQECEKCDDGKQKLLESISQCDLSISKTKTQLELLIQSHTKALLQQLSSVNTKLVKPMEMNKEDITGQLVMLESFVKFSQEVIDKATACDISRLADDLHSRAEKLDGMILTNAFPSPLVRFTSADIINFISESKLNIVGGIEDSDCVTGLSIDIIL